MATPYDINNNSQSSNGSNGGSGSSGGGVRLNSSELLNMLPPLGQPGSAAAAAAQHLHHLNSHASYNGSLDYFLLRIPVDSIDQYLDHIFFYLIFSTTLLLGILMGRIICYIIFYKCY
jgi:hypothetical protein